MNLAKLQHEAHAIAKSKGWWDEERSFGDLIALVHSELSEALEAYRLLDSSLEGATPEKLAQWTSVVNVGPHQKPVGIASELADVVIRVADMAEHYDIKATSYLSGTMRMVQKSQRLLPVASFGSWIANLHTTTTYAYCAYMKGLSNPGVTIEAWEGLECQMAMLISQVEVMAAHYGIDLDAAIEAKMEYNRSRTYRHGGKAL